MAFYFPEISLGVRGKNENYSGLVDYSVLTWQEQAFCLFACFWQKDQRNKEHNF